MPALKDVGITAMWIPPQCKGQDVHVYSWSSLYLPSVASAGGEDSGYGIYDLWDLGEFDQKGSVRTKYGTIEDALALSAISEETGMKLYFDAVLNHKAGADHTEKCRAEKVENWDRLVDQGPPVEISAWFGFDFEARKNKYSSMKWHCMHCSFRMPKSMC